MTTTSASPAPWFAKCSMTKHGTAWPTTSLDSPQGVKEPVLSRVFEYWKNVDPDLGKTIEEGVRANPNGNNAQ